MPDFKGVVEIQTAAGDPTLTLDGDAGDLTVGGSGQDGQVAVGTGSGVTRVVIDGSTGTVTVLAADGDPLVSIDGTQGDLVVYRKISGVNREVLEFDASTAELRIGNQGVEGDLVVRDGAGRETLRFNAATAALYIGAEGNEGDVVVRDGAGNPVMHFDSNFAALYLGTTGNEGDLVVRDQANRERIKLDGGLGDILVRDAAGHPWLHFDSTYAAMWLGGQGNEGDLIVRDGANRERIKLDGGEGDIWVRDASGTLLFHFDSAFAALYLGGAGNEGDLIVRNGNGDQTIKLDGGQGDIILTNGDAAEDFDVLDAELAAPGTVMVLGEDARLEPCAAAYDRKVVGVVSGAGPYRPGIVMDRGETTDGRRVPISVVGKVACRADAAYGSIRVGDLLTTSPSAGCAMRVAEPERAFGAVIGKALSPMDEGEGLVSMLIGLQ